MRAAANLLDVWLGLSASRAEQLNTLQVCLRAVVMYVVLIGYVRLGKKRFLGEATAFDAILVIIIGSIASRGISGNAPFIHCLAGVFILIAFHWVISYFSETSLLLSYLTKGHSTVVIHGGQVDRKALHAAHMSEDDLAEDLRHKGIENAKQVKEARLERDGKLSVIKK